MSWSPDRKFLVYYTLFQNRDINIAALPLMGERKPFAIAGTSGQPQISPDGKWITYASRETGRDEVYVRTFPAGDGHWQITTEGAAKTSVRWRGDSKELFYIAPGAAAAMMAVPVTASGSTFQWGTPHKLFDSGYLGLPVPHSYHDFAVSRDGQRFLIPRTNIATEQNPPITVVLNWTAALNQK